jgi:hypothetical protein
MRINPSDVEQYLIGLDFPADRDEIIEHAESQDTPDDIIDMLYRLPEKTYDSPTDVSYELHLLE